MMRVEWTETEDDKEWDDFVVKNGGSIFHTWSWRRILENEYSRPLYLACRDARGEILAVCPFFYRGGRQGRYIREVYLESLPDSRRASMIRGMAGPIVSGQLVNASEILARLPKSVKSSLFNPVVAMKINAHQERIVQAMTALGFRYEISFEFLIADLHEKTPEHIWNNGFRKHDRQAVKYYEQRGSEFRFAKNESEYIDHLALPGRTTARTSLNESADFLSKMRLNLGDRLRVARVIIGDSVIAGVSILCDPVGPTAHLAIIRYSPLRNLHSPVTYIDWKITNWAYEQGFRYVDFGGYFQSSDQTRPYNKLKRMFEVSSVPRYDFTLPLSSISYSAAQRANRLIHGMKSFGLKETAGDSNDPNKPDQLLQE